MNKEAEAQLLQIGLQEIKRFNQQHTIPTYVCPRCGERTMSRDPICAIATYPPQLKVVSFTCMTCGFQYSVSENTANQ